MKKNLLVGLAVLLVAGAALTARAEEKMIKLGLIGLDSSHVLSFTRYLNDPRNDTGCRVVAGYPGGSPDVKASAERIEGFTKALRDKDGLEIVGSIEELCAKVDGILLTSVDGRPHLQQVKPVLAAKKPVFIDKPMAASLADVVEIFRLAKEAGVPCWSSSSYRYSKSMSAATGGKVGKVLGCVAFGPCYLEAHHPDLYWYGVHTVETIFTLMGPGCESVTRTAGAEMDVVAGKWKDGRLAVFRGAGKGANGGSVKSGYVVFGSEGVYHGEHDTYEGLMKEAAKFFKTRRPPVEPAETIELFAFMTAADESKAKGGIPVPLKPLMDAAAAQK